MRTAVTNNWYEANQRYLMARLAVVREALANHADRAQNPSTGEAVPPRMTATVLFDPDHTLPGPSPLDSLCAAFSLSSFEREILLLCAGMDLDSTFPYLCAAAQGNPQRPFPTFSLALAALPEAHWSALTPIAPLRRWRLIEVGNGDVLTDSQLRIDERVLHYLAGVSHLDARLHGLVEPVPPPIALPPSQFALSQQIVRYWSHTKGNRQSALIHLGGNDHSSKQALAVAASAALDMQLLMIRAANIPAAAAEREALARLWEREAILSNSALLVDADDGENSRAVLAFLENVHGVLMVASREPLQLLRHQAIHIEVHKPTPDEQRQVWKEKLGSLASALNGHLDAIVSQFSLSVPAIHTACAQVLENPTVAPEGQSVPLTSQFLTVLWDVCRTQARVRLDDLAQRIEPSAQWSDLVLPEAQQQILRDIAVQVHFRTQVYEQWGFATKGARGMGLSVLFAGASGTGKTMAAEVLANELRLDLYRIDLSQVVSKYIGETEKNLRRVFDAAEEGGAVLLFDEADALFGKRSEVKDSHDRYANIEVSYLLQRMEAYRGLAILTTNMKSALDTAFLRRIRFIVQFAFPDTAQRMEIWRRVFPVETPTEGLDVHKLARLNVTGGNIRNIAVSAAFFAAHMNEPVRMTHVLRAARSEYTKLEKPLTEAETVGWL